MIRFALLCASAVLLMSAPASASAEPLAPLSPTKDKSYVDPAGAATSTDDAIKKSRRKTYTSVTRMNSSSDETIEPPAPEPAEPVAPEPGVKGTQHVPSKAVKHKSARDPANHEPYVPTEPYTSPYAK